MKSPIHFSGDDNAPGGQSTEWILFGADFPSYGSGSQGKLSKDVA